MLSTIQKHAFDIQLNIKNKTKYKLNKITDFFSKKRDKKKMLLVYFKGRVYNSILKNNLPLELVYLYLFCLVTFCEYYCIADFYLIDQVYQILYNLKINLMILFYVK